MGSAKSVLLTKKTNSNLDWISPAVSSSSSFGKKRRKRFKYGELYFIDFLIEKSTKFSKLNPYAKQPSVSLECQFAFRQLIKSWNNVELSMFCKEIDSGLAVRELSILADNARPAAHSLSSDLLKAFSLSTAADCFILFKGELYASHILILVLRSRYFFDYWKLLSKVSVNGKLLFPFIDDNVSYEIFKACIHFIYSGKRSHSPQLHSDCELQDHLLARLGCCTSLQSDFLNFNYEANGDCSLIFTSNFSVVSGEKAYKQNELRAFFVKCSSLIIATRSEFLCALIERRRRNKQPLEIVIDEHLFPRIYAHVVLHAFYTDRLDLSKILHGCQVSVSSLNEVQAIADGRTQQTPLRHAIDIYNIARFLNFSLLAQLCEDLMISELSVDNVGNLWRWASETGGSPFVRRHCVRFMLDEFLRVSKSNSFFDMDEEFLYECLISDYVQCSEIEILESVIRWGEHELVRRMAEREPNIIASTTHSISRKGIRRSELDDTELKHILSLLLPLIRVDYILPSFHPSLGNAFKRGLLDRSPNMDLSGQMYPDSRSPDVSPDAHWFDHSVPHRHPSGPRLLLPYAVETRSRLSRFMCSHPNLVSNRANHTNHPAYGKISVSVENMMPDFIAEDKRENVERLLMKILRKCEVVKRAFCCGCEHHRNLAIENVRLRILRELDINEMGLEVSLLSFQDRYNHILSANYIERSFVSSRRCLSECVASATSLVTSPSSDCGFGNDVTSMEILHSTS